MISKKELMRWLATIPEDADVSIDDGGLNLVVIGETEDTYLEVGGIPEKEPDDATIRASIHSDDYNMDENFNAVAWFRQASDDEIQALAEIGWRGDRPADEVGLFFSKQDGHPAALVIAYVTVRRRAGADMGFEVVVDHADALEWVRVARPALFEKIIKLLGK